MTIKRVETFEEFGRLRDEWNALLERSSANCVFLTHEWLYTWWKHLAGTGMLAILTARADGELTGILPLSRRRPQYLRMMPRHLEFLGSGVIGSDYLDAIVIPGREQEVMWSFSEHLDRLGLMLQLPQLRRGHSLVQTLSGPFQQKGWSVAEAKINVCPYINLAGLEWESYLATLGASHRYNFKRRLRGLTKASEIRLECVQSAAGAQDALDTVIALHRKRWSSTGASEAFQTDPVVAFHREFVGLAAGRGWLRLLILWVDNAPAAAIYGLRYGKTFYFYQSGFDPTYGKQSVGLVMMGLAIKAAIEEGASEYDLLHGAEEYKFHWANQIRNLGRVEFYPPNAEGRIYRRAMDWNRTARMMARRVLKKGL